jgi:type IV pilus assembly protein PilX
MTNYRNPSKNAQSGLVLLVALIVLAAMTMAGIALVRSVDTNALVASNLSHRQGAQFAGEAGVEEARAWLLTKLSTDLGTDTSDNVKWKDFDGSTQSGSTTPRCMDRDDVGNQVCYVVNRMCDNAGAIDLATCDVVTSPLGTNPLDSRGLHGPQRTGDVPPPIPSGSPPVFALYRVTVRTSGPRNNVSFIQVFLVLS